MPRARTLTVKGETAGRSRSTPSLGRLRDRIAPGVQVLFVGINPGIRSAMTGHHFAGYSNRFWKLLYDARLVPEPLTYLDDDRLPRWGYGITNIVPRATAGIGDLGREEYIEGRTRLHAKIARWNPRVVAMVGITVYRAMFPDDKGVVHLGRQAKTLAGAAVFVLPNPSGRNANYSYAEMREAFEALGRYHRRRRSPLTSP